MSKEGVGFVMDLDYYDFIKSRLVWLLNFWFEMEVEGLDSIPQEGPVLVQTKHCHFIDPAIICAVIARRMYGVSKDGNLKIPWLGKRLERMGMYPIDRKNVTLKDFMAVMSVLEHGKTCGYAPEMSRFSRFGARPRSDLSYFAEKWQNRKSWEGGEITHVVLGIDYSSTLWLRPRAKIVVRARELDVSEYEDLEGLIDDAGPMLAELSGLEYDPTQSYKTKYEKKPALRRLADFFRNIGASEI